MEEPDYQRLLDQLIRLEGTRLAPYQDADGSLILAVGHYLEGVGLNRGRAVTLLEADARGVARALDERLEVLATLDSVRRRVLLHMAMNLSVIGLLMRRRLIAAIEVGYWHVAADEMLRGEWAAQDTVRAVVLADMMRTGRDEAVGVSQPRSA